MILEQGAEDYESEIIIDQITPDRALQILKEIWKIDFKGRDYILAAIERIDSQK